MPEEELENEENDIDEAMLDELTDADAELEEEVGVIEVVAVVEDPEGDLEKDGLDEDDLFEDDAEDVDFDSFDDEDHL